ncbi:UNVERIFIED_CONTAM: LINE-1 reverse transcriptase, partial [Sesamum latifolium]
MGTTMFAITKKLKALKPIFRAHRQRKGDLSTNVKLAATFLDSAQALLAQDRQCPILLHLEFYCKLILRLATRLEKNMLHQRAKIAWMKGGDQCSRIFFRKVAKRRSSKRVFQITDSGGQVLTEQQDVINEFVAYYQNLLGGEHRDRAIDLCYLRPWARHILSEAEGFTLVQPVTRSEIKHAVFDIDEVKALGPDGYSSGFFKVAWPVIGEEVTRAIAEFFRTGRLLKQVNSTLISLIPKVPTPTVVAKFRPISCCNVLYKIITKIIVQRMHYVLGKLISPSQNAFVPGRSIGDNILLAQELFHGYNQQHLPPRCALKVDLRKAYDTVEWDFLSATLTLFGFPAQFISWIEECVTTPSFSVCLNGSSHGYFRGARGLRQGDPISPFLFVLVMEVLTLILLQFIDQDGGFSYHWRCGEVQLFQLGFADDLLLLSRADTSSIHIFKRGLMEGHLPLRYLGLPLLASRLSIADCKLILRKIDDRIKDGKELCYHLQGGSSLSDPSSVHYRFTRPGHLFCLRQLSERLRSAFASFFGRVVLVWGMQRFLGNRIGSGSSFSLWHDPWHDLGPLILRFPQGPRHSSTSSTAPLSRDRVIWTGPKGSFSSAAAYDVFHHRDP